MSQQQADSINGATVSRALARVAFVALAFTMHASSLRAGSIFDDDYKPPPEPMAKPEPKPEESPAEAPAIRRLPPTEPAKEAPAVTPPTPATPDATPVPMRAAIPTPAQLAAAEKVVRDAFRTEYAGRTPAAKAALARALLVEATQGANDVATQYIVLRDARDNAMAGGDVAAAVDASHGLRDAFNISAGDAAEMERAALSTAVRNLMAAPATLATADDCRAAVRLIMASAEADFAAGRYDAAAKLAATAEPVARRINWPDIGIRVHERIETLMAIASEAAQVRPAFAALTSNPADPSANLAVGRFYAFVLDRADVGMPYLAKSSDPVIKGLATREIAAPTESADQLAIADGWAAVCKVTPPGAAREGMQRRAIFWYDSAIAAMEGLAKAAAEKRVAEVHGSALRAGLLGEYFRGNDPGFSSRIFSRVDPAIEFDWRGAAPGEGLGGEHFTVRWTGYLKAPAPGDYKIVTIHDDGVRVWIDGVRVIGHWGDANRHQDIVHLTGALQQLKIEYWQGGGQSAMGLGWILPRAKKARAISSDAFFHDPTPAAPYLPLPTKSGDGTIVLSAAAAQLHNIGPLCEFDDRDRHVLGHWHNPATWLSWDLDVPEGNYRVDLEFSCGPSGAGGEYTLNFGNRQLVNTTRNTGSWNDYDTEPLGQIHLSPGSQFVRLAPKGPQRDALMNFSQMTLTPVKN